MRILVTGGTGDIGYQICCELLKEHTLIITGNSNYERLSKFENKNNVIDIIRLDLSNPLETINKLTDIDVDIFIHTVGISYSGLIQDMSIEDWDKVININLSSAFYISKCVIPSMIRKKFGKIIFLSSVWGKVGASCEVAYSASKGGLDSFAKALAKELAPSNISVNSLNLGFVDTKMNNNISLEEKNILFDDIPFSRPTTPVECAIFIKKIIEMPNYFTAQNINFDGGWQ